MNEFRHRIITLSVCIVLSIGSISFSWVMHAAGNVVDFYSKNESPFGISNGDWVAKYWNWRLFYPVRRKNWCFCRPKSKWMSYS